ncbi:SIN component scaffold protein Sid4 [Puccinia graminis f. sp. tritici]|uniref:SIN component scaffold protein Sid4 n=1 Tax=Puccinia graminis f. sp. tritici TaxID=56615 RepID=A0A5B0SE96_PUCGR|nr:SIN component scaffold protein Sid4 [Puccinia graminis f. sp. tritici]
MSYLIELFWGLPGSVIGNLASFVKGAAVVFPSETFDPDAVIRTVSEERCTVLSV